MKRIVLAALVTCLITVGALSQNKVVDDLVDKYAGQEGFTSVVITKYMFNLFSNIETTEDDEYMNMIKNLKNIKILTAPSGGDRQINLYDEVMKKLPAKEYEVLMEIKDGTQDVKFLVKEEKKQVVELLMLIGGDEDNVVMSISGIIDMKSIAKLAKSMNIEGMENLDKIEKKWPQ